MQYKVQYSTVQYNTLYYPAMPFGSTTSLGVVMPGTIDWIMVQWHNVWVLKISLKTMI